MNLAIESNSDGSSLPSPARVLVVDGDDSAPVSETLLPDPVGMALRV